MAADHEAGSDPAPPIRLIAGLGNPGRKYRSTRHNVGFEIVDRLAAASGCKWKLEKQWGAEIAHAGNTLLVKPRTYMNLSGEAIRQICGFHRIPPDSILVIHDDADLPLGRLRFRQSGSAGGHNGIKSIIQQLGSQQFPRLKVGIGRKVEPGADRRGMIGHVLGRFESAERIEMEKTLECALDAVNCALSAGLPAAMNRFNQDPEKEAAGRAKRKTSGKPADQEGVPTGPGATESQPGNPD
jgi:PTH1 family peptidyl-tRNA hydrolase